MLATNRLRLPAALAALQTRAGTTMGQGSEAGFALKQPLGQILLADRPTFSWQALAGAASYTVTITDPDNHYRAVAVSPALTATQWTPAQPLARGRTYAWQVSATRDKQTIKAPAADAPEARFRILESSVAAQLARAQKTYAQRPLTLGVLYAEAGLLAEAEREFKALSAANPASPVPQKLLQELRNSRR